MLINCVAYREGVKVADIPVEAINDYLAMPGHFVWVALKDPAPEELRQMQDEFNLHDLAVEDAVHGQQRPKVEQYGSCLFLSMHLVGTGTAADADLCVGEVAVFAGANFVLSVRNRSTLDFLGVRRRAEAEPELLRHGPGFVLYALMDAVVDRYFPVLDLLEEELEMIEDDIFGKGSARANIERLYRLKRRLMVLRRAVAPLLEAMSELQGSRVPPLVAGMQEYFRDVMDHLARINGSIDTIRDTINTAIQVTLSMTSIEENVVTKRLASWAAIFGVWTALAGVWGMNFEHMPELKLQYGYALALGTMAAACGGLFWRFRRAGWL
ncbi:magnesium/cobalt transporter CorA [Eleftheria terrae]|uniref:magnesium/cobalt transporter CorA n=1 Tax=Eleftheria terrae TaxID=1597781 RepID=UPI00263B8854|nr:magnesium/cobalt transporter CorA [Eleftheria terrae]WKB54400.1 magnesium/cobalt transporter CorA [Eleftheria terrae]